MNRLGLDILRNLESMDFILGRFLLKTILLLPTVPSVIQDISPGITCTSVRNVGGELKKGAWKKIGYWLWILEHHINLILNFANFLLQYFS